MSVKGGYYHSQNYSSTTLGTPMNVTLQTSTQEKIEIKQSIKVFLRNALQCKDSPDISRTSSNGHYTENSIVMDENVDEK